jgi:hypothetical protein
MIDVELSLRVQWMAMKEVSHSTANVDGEAIPVTEPERLRTSNQVPKLAARIQQNR